MSLLKMEPSRLWRGEQPFKAVRKVSTKRINWRTRTQARHGEQPEESSPAQKLGTALLSAALAFSVGATAVAPPPAHAEDPYEQRKQQMEKRKELLAKAREKALAAGGQETSDGDAPPSSSPAPAVSAAEDEKVKADTEEVLKSNAEREKEAERMRQSLKKDLGTYEQASKKDDSKLKAKTETTEKNPSWFQNFLEKNQKKDAEAPEASLATPAPLPFTTPTPPPPPKAAPQPSAPPASAPAFNFLKKAEPEAPKVTPPPEQSAKDSQPEPASPPPAAVKKDPIPQPPPPPPAPKPTAPPPLPVVKPTPPPPPPAPVETPTPDPVKSPTKFGVQPVQPELKGQKKADVKKGKKKGPLPMALAQILLLAIFGVLGYGTIVKEDETNAVLATLGKYIAAAYGRVEGLVSKKSKST